ncbi:MBOAT family protein [Larkinella knui]|uniref:MBOAT family protein n=1 Tax=Larkinella knui TaxID=2025310 RepID=A0A3P1CQQ6_9BACT|nr:MBOAT family O-acyltransferase [Larkinella knui]RRB15294.1 MBOAT family protein [Larkinella knui]
MSLSSILYLFFLLLVFAVYYALPHRFRWSWLLLAGYFFYFTFHPLFLILLVVSTSVAYGFGRLVKPSQSRLLLGSGVGLLLLPLLFFKYYAFLNQNLTSLLGFWGHSSPFPSWAPLVPVGISFYTFQAISYLIDIRRGYLKPERHFGYFATYLAFFPTLSAGPIERAKRLLTQLHTPQPFRYENAVAGLQLIAWGLFKKVVIANQLAALLDPVFAQPQSQSGLVLYSALIFAPFQIFCDFSGYSDIARGSARMLGLHLMRNFDDRVYASSSRIEFWKGWHISLTSWFRDYVYFPLSKSLRSRTGLYMNLLVVYFLTGLWHGATWGYILWGLLNGLWLVAEHATKAQRQSFFRRLWPDLNAPAHRFLSTLLVFHAGALMGVFLRAPTVGAAGAFLTGLVSANRWEVSAIGGVKPFIPVVLGLLLMDIVNRRLNGRELPELLASYHGLPRWSFYLALCILILTFGRITDTPFFYYQF